MSGLACEPAALFHLPTLLLRVACLLLLPAAGAAAQAPPTGLPLLPPPGVEAHFEIDLAPAVADGRFDPQRDRIGLRGSAAPLSWGASAYPMALSGHRYGVRVRIERPPFGGQPLQYKFVIERGARGLPDIWEPGRNHPLWLQPAPDVTGPVGRVARAFGAEPAALPVRRAGTIERLGVVRSAHVMAREVQVWLPPDHGSDPTRRYPVLVLHDGQNVFDASHAGAEWQFDETAQRLAASRLIDPPIIVAVGAGPDRMADYTPTAAPFGSPPRRQGGGAGAYGRFLAEELLPLIAQRYRIRPGPAGTAVGGSSLGGLVSLWLALHRPDVFGAALVVSPSLWWDNESALRDVLARPPGSPRPRLWLDMGGRESEQGIAQARALREALRQKGWSVQELAYVEDPLGTHDEATWASRVEGMLRFLYGRL